MDNQDQALLRSGPRSGNYGFNSSMFWLWTHNSKLWIGHFQFWTLNKELRIALFSVLGPELRTNDLLISVLDPELGTKDWTLLSSGHRFEN